eukprot:TRINITY_DN5004_c0_g1_i1.p1 TRINITY_DN5004_c0_g1~~TRINITY_DN5004_c0_g1_i1.p1  ORF type:complete len:1293 (+),score=278.73 TRINITY_DN5004_c0_g1_i1:42-3881(+)
MAETDDPRGRAGGDWQQEQRHFRPGATAVLNRVIKFKSGKAVEKDAPCTIVRVPGVKGEFAQLRAPSGFLFPVSEGQARVWVEEEPSTPGVTPTHSETPAACSETASTDLRSPPRNSSRTSSQPEPPACPGSVATPDDETLPDTSDTASRLPEWRADIPPVFVTSTATENEPLVVPPVTMSSAVRTFEDKDVREHCDFIEKAMNGVPLFESATGLAVGRFVVVPRAGMPCCVWHKSCLTKEKVPQSVHEFADRGECFSGIRFRAADGEEWVLEFGPDAPTKPVMHCMLPMSVLVQLQDAEEELHKALRTYIVMPPKGYASCACRASPRMKDKVPQRARAWVAAGEHVFGQLVRVRTEWWLRLTDGYYLPSAFLRGFQPPVEQAVAESHAAGVLGDAEDVVSFDGPDSDDFDTFEHTTGRREKVVWRLFESRLLCNVDGREPVEFCDGDRAQAPSYHISGSAGGTLDGFYILQTNTRPLWQRVDGGAAILFDSGKWKLISKKPDQRIMTWAKTATTPYVTHGVWQPKATGSDELVPAHGAWKASVSDGAVSCAKMTREGLILSVVKRGWLSWVAGRSVLSDDCGTRLAFTDNGTTKWQYFCSVAGTIRSMAERAGIMHGIPKRGEIVPSIEMMPDLPSHQVVCVHHERGCCRAQSGQSCRKGAHRSNPAPTGPDQDVLREASPAKREWLKSKLDREPLLSNARVKVWEIENPFLAKMFEVTAHNFSVADCESPKYVDAWHGTDYSNVLPIILHGFDPKKRKTQAYGAGEYFASKPIDSMLYATGPTSFLLFCRLCLGAPKKDHSYVPGQGYYVMKQKGDTIQALPRFLVEIAQGPGTKHRLPARMVTPADHVLTPMASPRPDAAMHNEVTQALWLGPLEPQPSRVLRSRVADHLRGVAEPCRIDIGKERGQLCAYVTLRSPITKSQYQELAAAPFGGCGRVFIDDASPRCPVRSKLVCPRLREGRYCRGWNLHGGQCAYRHPSELAVVKPRSSMLVELPLDSAVVDGIVGEMQQGAGLGRRVKVLSVREVTNTTLAAAYAARRAEMTKELRGGQLLETELWHGTDPSVVSRLIENGLQPPSDVSPHASCRSGKHSTSLCCSECEKCADKHKWARCHMYGLGVYFADQVSKAMGYCQDETVQRDDGRCFRTKEEFVAAHGERAGEALWKRSADTECRVRTVVRCQVTLGTPALIDRDLAAKDALHDVTSAVDPAPYLTGKGGKSDETGGYDSYFVRGKGFGGTTDLSTYNNEYVVFDPSQVWPRYVVSYTLTDAPEGHFWW